MQLQNHQLANEFERMTMKNGNQQFEPGYSGIGFYWYGMPVYQNAMTRYGAMSTASNTSEPKVVDRSAGDRAKNSGLVGTGAPATTGTNGTGGI